MSDVTIKPNTAAPPRVPDATTEGAPPAPPHAPAAANTVIAPKTYEQSLVAAAQRGVEFLHEAFDLSIGVKVPPPPPPPAPPSPAHIAQMFGLPDPAAAAAVRSPFAPKISETPPLIANPSNPSFPAPKTFFDLAQVACGAYGTDPQRGKIALYSAGKTPDGKPVVLVDIAGTEFDKSGAISNTPANWGAAGTGASTDLERETTAAIQDAYRRGEIPKDAVIDLTGHSLGAIVANNISGRTYAPGVSGKIPVTGTDGTPALLPIRNVIGFGTPLPSIWSNDVHYVQRVAPGDIVGNIPTNAVGSTKIGQWQTDPAGPAHLDRKQVHLQIPNDDLGDGGHRQYNKSPDTNPLTKEAVPPSLQYSAPLTLLAAYKDPALVEPSSLPDVSELTHQLLSPGLQRDLDATLPQWRSWISTESEQTLKQLPPGVRSELANSTAAIFQTYFQSDAFQKASPAERQQLVKQDEGRLRTAVQQIVTPMIEEEARQRAEDLLTRVK